MVLIGAGRGRVVLDTCKRQYVKYCRDCDGDDMSVCTYSGSCPYKKVVMDCDGDLLELCEK